MTLIKDLNNLSALDVIKIVSLFLVAVCIVIGSLPPVATPTQAQSDTVEIVEADVESPGGE